MAPETNGLEVCPVSSRGDREAFIGLPYVLHRGTPQWVAPLRRDVRVLLSRKHNPFFQHAEAEYFLARRRGAVIGRVAAIHNRLHNEYHSDRVGFFGMFESAQDPAAAAALFHAASTWLRGRGLASIRGPVNLSTNDECGLLVSGFETPPTLLMTHNPSYYVELVEGAGFTKAKDLLAYQTTSDRLPDRLMRGAKLLESRYGITTRSMDPGRYEAEVALVKRLYNASWQNNWGFVPLTEPEMDHLAHQLRPVVVPELVAFAERGGEPVGVGIALPDLNVALKANPSGRLFPGIVKVLWASRGIRRLRVLLLGALPEWHQKGVDALLYKWIWEKGYAKGYRWAEAGWILEDNFPMRNGVVRMGFEAYKTYRIYERPLPA
jgi:hypothetical protein